jgi:hypothetical protein
MDLRKLRPTLEQLGNDPSPLDLTALVAHDPKLEPLVHDVNPDR